MTARPTHILRHEHRIIEQVLRAIEGMCFKLKTGENVPIEALSQALEFVQNFADRFHHMREEEFLFPALEQAGFGREGGALYFLQEEHLIERELLVKLEFAVREYRYGDPDAASQFVEAANQFCRHLVGHMQKEDNLLFRIAEEVISEESKTELMQHLLPKNGGYNEEGILEYERMASSLENAWAI